MTELPTILLVEDNLDDYEATVRSFKKNRFVNPITWCRNGQDAMDYLSREGAYANDPEVRLPDIILLDLNMPGIDGRQLLEQLKGNPRFYRIPIIVLTTSADSKDVDRCYVSGANSYIQKPVTFDGLTEAIRTMHDYWFNVAILPPHLP